VNVPEGKMAKSEGNQITLKDVVEKGYSPRAYRYFLLLSHYRTPTTFSWEALDAAQNAYRRLKETYSSLIRANGGISESYKKEFDAALENDLNTPEALAVVWKLVKDESASPADKQATLLEFDKVLGLNLDNNEYAVGDAPEEVLQLMAERDAARMARNYDKADQIRIKISQKGYEILDTASGQELKKL
jgi:cysteinyl-tRNA synthetase